MPSNTGRVLLAWEGGAGRGHIVTLKTIAEALGDGFVYDAALCRMDHAAEIEPLCERVFPSAYLGFDDRRRRAAGNPGTASWADFLGDLGFADHNRLIRQIEWWLKTIEARQSSLMVGDFSPIAMLAARVAGIPVAAVGTGYSTPPPGMAEFPILLAEHQTRIYPESELVEAVNTALRHFGQPQIVQFSDIYRGVTAMPRTIAALDPYTPWRQQPLLPPLNEALPRGGPAGDEIFIYFSTRERDDPVLMEAIGGLGLPTRLYMPAIANDLAERLTASGVNVERSPVPIEAIAARSRLMLHAGQHGSLCMALGLGLPQIAFPQHLEHLYHARRAAELGTVSIVQRHERDMDAIRRTIRDMHADDGRLVRARALADDLYPSLFGNIAKLVQDRLLPLLG
jgi:UDP:flavonoid glycosyltransferase YjiC (YdhE family)